MKHYDVLIVGAGAAGMAAALSAHRNGVSNLILVEREDSPGGVLLQCLHQGFGRSYFGEELTGRAYAARVCEALEKSGMKVMTKAAVLSLSPQRTALISSPSGLWDCSFSQCVLATGCRETPIDALSISGTRPSGIFTAGMAQKMLNVSGYDIGDWVVILGSGDVGQIMARQLTQCGKRVVAIVEQNGHLGGLAHNRRECIEKFQIPVILRSTVCEIFGENRIRGVMIRNLETGTSRYIACDTLVTALGLIPEQELLAPFQTQEKLPEWLHLCGNCDYVHKIVDTVTIQGEEIGSKLMDASVEQNFSRRAVRAGDT